MKSALGTLPGLAHPFNADGAGNVSDPIPFGTCTDVDQPSTGRELPDFVRFGRRQHASIGEAEFAGPVLREREQFGEFFP